MDERLSRRRRLEQRVPRRGHLPEPRADGEQDVGIPDTGREQRVDADADIADIARRVVVQRILAPERRPRGQRVRLEEDAQVGGGGGAPPRPADQGQRPLGSREQSVEPLELRGCGIRRDGRRREHVGGVARRVEHVLGQREHDRSRPARARGREGAPEVLGDAVDPVDLRHPFRQLAEQAPVVELLEGLAVLLAGAHLADEEDQRRRVLARRMQADGRVRRSGPARDEADPRAAGELAVRVGHVRRAGLVPAGDQTDRRIVEGVEDRQEALAGNAEDGVGGVAHELIDEQLPARAGHRSRTRSKKTVGRCSFGRDSSSGST